MTNKELINREDFAGIAKLAKETVSTILGFGLAHAGINSKDASQAEETADLFANVFGLPKRETSSSIFVGKILEIMRSPFYGANGHIAIATNSVERAVYYLKKVGISFNEKTAKYDAVNNSLKSIYLEKEIGGFAVHLVIKYF